MLKSKSNKLLFLLFLLRFCFITMSPLAESSSSSMIMMKIVPPAKKSASGKMPSSSMLSSSTTTEGTTKLLNTSKLLPVHQLLHKPNNENDFNTINKVVADNGNDNETHKKSKAKAEITNRKNKVTFTKGMDLKKNIGNKSFRKNRNVNISPYESHSLINNDKKNVQIDGGGDSSFSYNRKSKSLSSSQSDRIDKNKLRHHNLSKRDTSNGIETSGSYASAKYNGNSGGNYEEQMPIVVASGSKPSISHNTVFSSGFRTGDRNNANGMNNEWHGMNQIQNLGGYDGDYDYYRQRYLATTPRTFVERPNNDNSDYDEDMMNDRQQSYNSDYNDYEQPTNSNLQKSTIKHTEPKSDLFSFINRAKTVWDVFVAMNSAWNAVAKQQQKAINRNNEIDPIVNETSTTIITTQTNQNLFETSTTSMETDSEDDQRSRRDYNKEGISTDWMSTYNDSNTNTEMKTSTELATVGEGRYIKGDPLNGYYDFIISEGSYKFWAIFQIGTALLIIYSTFAAIYYSKVSPLVGDYDYTDYLGGARSLSDDSDFVDLPYADSIPNSSGENNNNLDLNSTSIWSTIAQGDWIPRAGHSLKFILDAIDKLPQSET